MLNGVDAAADQSILNGSQNGGTEEPVILQKTQKAATPPPKKAASPAPEAPAAEIRDASDIEDYEGEESMRYLTEDEMAYDNRELRNALERRKARNNMSFTQLIQHPPPEKI